MSRDRSEYQVAPVSGSTVQMPSLAPSTARSSCRRVSLELLLGLLALGDVEMDAVDRARRAGSSRAAAPSA